jgi:hypothetical protein
MRFAAIRAGRKRLEPQRWARDRDSAVTQATQTALVELEACYARVLEQAARLGDDPKAWAAGRDEFAAFGFAKLDNVLAADALLALVQRLLPFFLPVAELVAMRQVPQADHRLSDGVRFWRVDPHTRLDPEIREKLTLLLDGLGFVQFGALLASKLTPVIRHVAGPVSYRRVYFYIYKEGDYISVHDDHHVGARVDVQFPLTLLSSGGIRVLKDGFLETYYDRAGSMNLLGPRVWHDVPPLLRAPAGEEPLRVNLGFRFTPDDKPTLAGA